jgi:acyl-coenzyme A synthetase/AMP-(fatty) acid ligase
MRRAALPQGFAELAAFGAKAALRGAQGELSYAAFAARAEAVAEALSRAGVGEGEPVGLLSRGRGFDEAVGLMGILASGRVAVPLDASSPPARLASILAACGARGVVRDSGAPFREGEGAVVLGAEGLVSEVVAASLPVSERSNADLACVLHTSGSTGTPKPVPITWAGLDAFTTWAAELAGLGPDDGVLRVAELVFDLAWFDHLATFRAGATLLLLTRRELVSGKSVVEAIRRLGPSVIYGVPSLFMKLTAVLGEAPLMPCPRVVYFAGEVFPPKELRAFSRCVPEARLVNLFGPTETNVCTYHEVARAELDGERETPIGRPCPYAACELRAEDGSVVSGPGEGELIVSGPTVVGGGPYATRDRVLRGEDGLFYFRGRMDRMLKIRGFRVDPGDVEAHLAAHPAVHQAAVVTREDPRTGLGLVGYVAVDGSLEERELRAFLAERLPPYMVPERVDVLAELPRTATGKVDYAALAGLLRSEGRAGG